jgi:hypothetical protein
MRWRPLVATSKREPQSWRYVMWNGGNRPALDPKGNTRLPNAPLPEGMADWHKPAFDDSGWKEAKGAFGVWKAYFQYLVEKYTTELTADYIVMRKTFDLDDADLPILRLNVLSREAVDVYLNGESLHASDKAAARPRYQKIRLDAVAAKLLRKGKNVLAVRTRVNYWLAQPYGLIDVGLEGAKPIPPSGK